MTDRKNARRKTDDLFLRCVTVSRAWRNFASGGNVVYAPRKAPRGTTAETLSCLKSVKLRERPFAWRKTVNDDRGRESRGEARCC